jgi:hypothetical protein
MAMNNAASQQVAMNNYGQATDSIGQASNYEDNKPKSRQSTANKSSNRLGAAGMNVIGNNTPLRVGNNN